MSYKVLLFTLGLLVGLALTPAVHAVEQALMYGSDSGAARVVQVTSSGAVKIHLN